MIKQTKKNIPLVGGSILKTIDWVYNHERQKL